MSAEEWEWQSGGSAYGEQGLSCFKDFSTVLTYMPKWDSVILEVHPVEEGTIPFGLAVPYERFDEFIDDLERAYEDISRMKNGIETWKEGE